MSLKLSKDFFLRDVLNVAPDLIGKILCRRFDNGNIQKYKITEVEAYRGKEDLACHASKGRTPRTEIMYNEGGHIYVYLIYGMYWMLNFVTSEKDIPQAVLIRGVEGYDGPGKLTKALKINKSFYGENIITSERLWIEEDEKRCKYITTPRIGIDYSGDVWKNKPWRFILKD